MSDPLRATAAHGPPPSIDVGDVEEDLLSTPRAGIVAVRGGSMRLLSFLVGSLVSVVAAALLFRHLGVTNSGHFTLALTLSAVVTGFTDLGLTAIGIRELAVLKGEARARLARNLLGIRLVLTSLGVIVISAFAFLVYGRTIGFGVLIAGIGVLAQNTQVTLEVPLMATLRLGWVSLLDAARQILNSILIIALVVVGARFLPFLATVAVAAGLVLIPTALLVRGNIPLAPAFGLREWKILIGPVFTYSVAVAAATLYFRVAIVLVSLIAHGRQLGYFSVPYRAVEVLFVIPGLLVGAAFPIFARAAREDPERLGYALSRVFEVSLLVGVWVALTLAVGARFVVELLGGPRFLPSTSVLAVQGIAVGATFVSAVWGYGMLSLHLHRMILIFNVAMLVLVAAVVAPLVAIDGAQGAAIGIAATELVAASASGLVLCRGRPHLAPRLRVLPRAAVAALLGATPALVVGLPIVARVMLSTIIYGAVLLALKAPPAEVYEAIPVPLRWRRPK
jgi:O-antigen/teichoic acid export membrane protein